MSDKGRVYPRHDHGGEEFLLLLEGSTLRRIDISLFETQQDLETAVGKYNSYMKSIQDFWLIETRTELKLFQTPHGHTWCVENSRRNSQSYVRFRSKAEKWEKMLIRQLNKELSDEAKGRRESHTDSTGRTTKEGAVDPAGLREG